MNKFDDLYFKKAAWLCEASEDDDDEDKVEEDETETDDTAEDADVEAVEEIECPDCDGTGEDEDGEECETCGGTGVIAPEESEEDIVADAEDAISDAEDDDDDAEADPDVEPDPDEEYELDLADPVCPCCGAHLNVISDTETDAEETATEEDVPTTEVDGFEVADPSIMGPETNIYYSDEDAEPVEYEEDGEEDDDDVDESTQVNEAKKILKNVGMSREDKTENAKNFNQPKYNGYKIPKEGDPEIWKIIIDWMDFIANKNNYKFKYDEDYDNFEMEIYTKSGIYAFLEATVNKELYKNDKIHIKAFCAGKVYDHAVNIKNADEQLEIGYKTIMNKLEDLLKNSDQNIDMLIDKIENMALEYLSKVGDDLDGMLYSNVESGIKNGDMGDDFQNEFEDGPYPKGKKLKEWITDWVNAQIDNCLDNYDTDY